ncbi:MAG: epoxyqueuosine reductase [Paracoccaceae bacterium]|jgi:epoxyqueuosine reductase
MRLKDNSCSFTGSLLSFPMPKLPPYTPDPEQMALWPDASGNDINGLHEAEFRRPKHVYWGDPDKITFGPVQKWFYTKNADPSLQRGRAERMEEEKIPLPPIASVPVNKSPSEWADALKSEALRLGADDVGVARISADWAYQGWEVSFSHIVVLAIAMDYDEMLAAPEPSAGAEVVRQYTRGMKTSKALAGWLRNQGHDAEAEHGPFAEGLTMVPAAIAAGLGELGKHGSIINAKLGSCFRLAAVLTNLPLTTDDPVDNGTDGFCENCQICARQCPPQAITHDKQAVRGYEKWYVDFDKFLPFFNEHAGCAICITVCPFSRPGVGENLIAKLARRTALD